MGRFIIGLLCAAVAALAVTPAAEAKTLRAKYRSLYATVAKVHGKRAPGRNILRQGVQIKHGKRKGKTRPATNHELARSVRTFRRWLAPPPAPVAPHDGAATSAPAYSGGNYSIPASIVMCESHGDYGAYNPSSGAGGAYQILPSTWRAYGGTGSPHTASPAEQDRVAARVWAGQGRSAWVC